MVNLYLTTYDEILNRLSACKKQRCQQNNVRVSIKKSIIYDPEHKSCARYFTKQLDCLIKLEKKHQQVLLAIELKSTNSAEIFKSKEKFDAFCNWLDQYEKTKGGHQLKIFFMVVTKRAPKLLKRRKNELVVSFRGKKYRIFLIPSRKAENEIEAILKSIN